MGLQDPATPFMQNCIDVHMETMTIIMFMIGLNYYLLGRITLRYINHPQDNSQPPGKTLEHPWAETVYTLVPVGVVVLLAVSAFGLIYSEEVLENRDSYTGLTVKIIGRQWYWSYNYPSFMEDFDGDSYMVPEDECEDGMFRNLEVDNRLVLPTNTPIRLIITASDVIHSWSVPSFGIKCDAIPGRLNMVNTIIKRPGVFYG